MKTESLAKQALEIAKQQSGAWDTFLRQVQATATQDEFLEYRQKAAEIMAALFLEIIDPISRQFPALKPDWFNPVHRQEEQK